ncbi:TetR/AcrR family transcriptional regulator [Gordonia polyisoprenivorans]|uniref:TetR/AcrR family transcriptional regulator n=1 Tax=Gordonia polyisoprenivorans TaxID=84595 RepID=UPI001AD61582|nr:TetR/AcrR family transcriptional regulator [Gordonia polyisoprenivorans]QTI69014.1 TetR/AcrR family transcriptional regulator [Gordonia polyisoprenivorans]
MARRKTGTRDGATGDDAAASKSERTRARILDAAAEVLSRKGYAGMRLTDVATVAELQAPAIYYYFDSREDLIEEVMWVGIADMREHVTGVLDELPDGTDPLERILAAVDAHLRHELQISAYTTASIRNSGQVPEHIRTRQIAEEARYGKIWRQLIKRAFDEGRIRQDLDLYIVQMLVLGSLNWAAEWWSPRRGSVDKVVTNAQEFVRSALIGATAVEAAEPLESA